MKKIINLIIVLYGIFFLMDNVYALNYINKDNIVCTETKEHKIWDKLPAAEKSKTFEPIKCEETINSASLVNLGNLKSIGNVDYKTAIKFDLRDYNLVTSVKDQEDTSLCWSFATCSTIESSYLNQTGNILDLSEKHIDYAVTYSLDDGNINPLGYYNHNKTFLGTMGGNYFMSGAYLSTNRGPIMEDKLPWSTTSSTLENATQISSDYFVKNINYLANESCYDTEDTILEIKKLLTTYGALAATMSGSLSNMGEDGVSFYYNGDEAAGHAVTIIGWDDSYSKSNFADTPSGIPAGDGAWIVKNSYLSTGEGGYHYISYYDSNICDVLMSVNDVEKITNKYNSYFYDSLGFSTFIYLPDTQTYYLKLLFSKKNTGSELLNYITLFMGEVGDEYEVFYSTSDNMNDAVSIGSGTATSFGYTTLNLKEPIAITADEFYIFVKYKVKDYIDSDGEKYYLFPAQTVSWTVLNTFYVKDPQTGVAFYSNDMSTWTDFVSTTGAYYPLVHAFTTNSNDTSIIIGDYEKSDYVTEDEGGYYYIPLELVNVNINDIKVSIYNENNENVTDTFDISKQDSGFKISVILKNTKAGKYTVYFEYDEVKMYTKIEVLESTKILLEKIAIQGGNEVAVGGNLYLTTVLTPSNATVSGLKWSSSDEKVATVNDGKVTGVSHGTATISVESIDDPNIKASIKLTVIDIDKVENNNTSNDVDDVDDIENPSTGLKTAVLFLLAALSVIPLFVLVFKKGYLKKV